MAYAQKPDLVFRRNGRVHLNRRGHQFSRLLTAEVCASAVVMLVTHCFEVEREYWLPTPFASFPFTSPPVRHHVPSRFNWTLPFVTQCSSPCNFAFGLPRVETKCFLERALFSDTCNLCCCPKGRPVFMLIRNSSGKVRVF